MGMFDTIYFDQKYICPLCGKEIGDIQTKEFENLLNYYHVKDCISHAEDIKEMVKVIESRKDRRIFYYKGLYGSLVPDVENDRLTGKIEGIDRDIVYEGNTVGECENRFREAVSLYLKTMHS